jgi:glycosyltransferase involved in cell wall biosynthesis
MAKPRLNILQLRSHAGFYGVEKVVVELAAGLQERGHSVTIGIIQAARQEDRVFQTIAETSGLACRIFPSSKPLDRNTVKELAEYLAAEPPDLIHTHGYKADVIGWMANRSLHLPLISTIHPWLDTAANRRAAFYAFIDKLILLRFDRVVAISEQVRRQCHVCPLKKRKIPVIANGIKMQPYGPDSSHPDIRHELNLPPECLVLGCVARLTEEKGHAFLINAFAGLPRATHPLLALLLIGEGARREGLQQLCRDLRIEKQVHFLGHRENINALLQQMDLFILPSLSEGVPMALLEAMAAGVPAVATSVGAVPAILDHGSAGLLVAPGDSTALAAALLELIENRSKRQQLASHGRDRAAAAYSRELMCRLYEDEYYALTRRKEGQT